MTDLARKALDEDIGTGDITTELFVSECAEVKAVVFARGDIVVCGNEMAKTIFHSLDSSITYSGIAEDGCRVKRDDPVAEIRGKARPILTGERTALNFMQRMSGIATLTSKFVEKVSPYGVAILDTRKTTPLLRIMEKYAVRCGGGVNHRMGLHDRILIKDNHKKLLQSGNNKDNLIAAIARARQAYPNMLIEVEVETEPELLDALKADPDWILLDNMTPDNLSRYVRICAGKCRIEASGGITLDNIEEVARTGVDAVSLGCLTHSAAAADLSLEVM